MLAAVLFILAILTLAARAQAAGPATNIVTLYWTPPPPQQVPYVFELQQSNSITNASWFTIANNIPSNVFAFSVSVDRDMKWFRMRLVNATNSIWTGDFGNTASTAWPGQGGTLSIRLGP